MTLVKTNLLSLSLDSGKTITENTHLQRASTSAPFKLKSMVIFQVQNVITLANQITLQTGITVPTNAVKVLNKLITILLTFLVKTFGPLRIQTTLTA